MSPPHAPTGLSRYAAVPALTALACTAALAQATIELSAGLHRIEAEVANTYQTRMTGLMHRREMPRQRGMLFVFPEVERHCMWMRNTYLPLSVAFLDEKGVVINIADMQRESDATHCAAGPARYALEMNKGWFAERNVRPGARISGIEKAPAPR